LYDKIYSFITLQKNLRGEHFGFRKRSSTTITCFKLIKEVSQNLNDAMILLIIVIAIFLDMSKAFDFVSHKLLLRKLAKYKIREIALLWIHSYLSYRQQCVEISKMTGKIKDKHYSSYQYNRCGVPQGSVLDSLLFLLYLYINDLPNVMDQKSILFSDDFADENNSHLFSKKRLHYRGRKRENLYIPCQRLVLYSRNSYWMAIQLYNKLPDSMKYLPLHKFKNNLCQRLLNKMYYTVKDFLNDNIH
jgi:hypothetical protein